MADMSGNHRRRRGRDSRCCSERDLPLSLHDYTDPTHGSIVAFVAWLRDLAPFARDFVTGEIAALLDDAMEGNLYDTGDERTPIKPIRVDPEIFELRRTVLSKKLRMYHGEPAEFPDFLVQIHLHMKIDKKTQEEEIAYSADRYTAGYASKWGIAQP